METLISRLEATFANPITLEFEDGSKFELMQLPPGSDEDRIRWYKELKSAQRELMNLLLRVQAAS